MSDSTRQSDERRAIAELKELCGDGSRLINIASKAQKRELFLALEALFPSRDSMLTFSLQLLVSSKRVARCIEEASAAHRKSLAMVLEDLRANDRRAHPRKLSSIRITIDNVHTAVARNISVSGVFLHTPVPFSVEQQIALDFGFPSEQEPTKMTGKVTWTSRFGVGVQFTSPLSGELRQMIEAL